MRRFVDRIRDECVNGLHLELIGAQNAMEISWSAALEGLRHDINDQRDAAHSHDLAERHDLAGVLDRLAGALEGLTEGLEAERRERLVQIGLVECLLREMIIAGASPVPGRAKVVGGSIDVRQLDSESAESEVDLRGLDNLDSDAELTVGMSVEVRSRFHDRWSSGFRIAEVVNDSGCRRFRLTRRSDGISLPLLFDATDVRRQLLTTA
jgi:hypothetical protein